MGALSNFRRKASAPAAQAGGVAPGSGDHALPNLPANVVCRPALREEISLGLRLILGAGGAAADDEQVVDFMQFALRRGIGLADLWLAERTDPRTGQRMLAWTLLPVASPGRTLLLLGPSHPPHGRGGELAAIIETLVERVCEHFAARGVQLAQVLLDPADARSRGLYEGRGFRRVAELVYLQGSPRRKAAAPALPAGFAWLTYGPETHDAFVSTIAASYQDSLDCPSLNGLRDMDDVLAGHKASGEFDPSLWLLLCEWVDAAGSSAEESADRAANSTDDATTRRLLPRGALLLSRMQPGDTVELVYLGLTPASRGRGLGDLLVKQALAAVAAQGLGRLSLAVDSNNAPALKLYYRHGLQRVASKVALMRMLQPPFTAGTPPASASASSTSTPAPGAIATAAAPQLA